MQIHPTNGTVTLTPDLSDKKSIKAYLNFIEKIMGAGCLNTNCMINFAACVVSNKLNTHPSGKIKNTLITIQNFILLFRLPMQGGLIHQAISSNDTFAVKTLLQFDPRHRSIRSGSGKSPIEYIHENFEKISCEIRQYVALIPEGSFLRYSDLTSIACSQQTPLDNSTLVESLFLKMRDAQLLVQHRLDYMNATYFFTQSFFQERFEDRPLVLFFVKVDRIIYARLAWNSQSQMIWRVIDKPFYEEEGIALPWAVNVKLNEIHKETSRAGEYPKLSTEEGKELLQYVLGWSKEGLEEGIAIRLSSNQIPSDPRINDFKEMHLRPDFSKSEEPELLKNHFYGKVGARPVLSVDETIRYIFIEVTLYGTKMVFLSTAEVKDEGVDMHGLSRKPIELGSLGVPLKEYPDLFTFSEFILEEEKDSAGDHVTTWNYLKQMPFINEYMKAFF